MPDLWHDCACGALLTGPGTSVRTHQLSLRVLYLLHCQDSMHPGLNVLSPETAGEGGLQAYHAQACAPIPVSIVRPSEVTGGCKAVGAGGG